MNGIKFSFRRTMRRCIRKHVLPSFLGSLFLLACGADKTQFRSLDDTGGPAPITSFDSAPQYMKTFNAGKLETVKLSIDSGFKLIMQDISLIQAPKTAELSQQINRPVFEDSFIQGNNGTAAQESFAISEAGIFDLLIVIDNSSSMGPYQDRLGRTLPSILRYISNTNWRIAVVTSSNACLNKTRDGRRYVTRTDFDRDPVKATNDFNQLIVVGENGDSIERGIKMATDALTGQGCPNESNDWLRADSQRSILLVTDENNCGSGPNEGCPGAAFETADYFFDRVGYNVSVNAFLLLEEPPSPNPSNPNDPNRDCVNSGGYGVPPNAAEYIRIVQSTGGIYADVCRSNYDAILEQISLKVRKKINIQFELIHPAVSSSLDISIDGKKIKNFTINERTLTILESVSESAQSLTVKYKHTPVGMVKKFLTRRSADGSSLEVFVNGDKLVKANYSYDAETACLELNNFPPEYAQIKLRYRDNIPLRKIFNYTSSFVPNTLEVWVDDRKVSNFVHDPIQKRVTFTTPPLDGQSVSLRFEMPGDRKLNYNIIGADAATIERMKLIDLETGADVQSTIQDGQLVLGNEDVSQGRKLRAIYNMNYDFKDKVYSLGISAPPFPGSLKIDAEGDALVCSQNIKVSEEKLRFTCTDEDFEWIQVSYQFAADYKNSFDIAVNYSGPRSYEVFINGQRTEKYHIIEERLVILKKDLPTGAEVRVLIKPK